MLENNNALVVCSNSNEDKMKKCFDNNMLLRFIGFLDVSKKTANTYRKALKQLMSYFKVHGVVYPQVGDILNFKRELADKGRKPATIALYLSAIRRFFQWTAKTGIYSNIAAGIKSPKMAKEHRKDCFSGMQIKSIMSGIKRNSLEGLRNYAMFALILSCGLRTIEVARANIGDIRTVAGVSMLFIQGKGRTDKTDFVKLAPKVEQAINDYLKARGIFNPDEPLFSSNSRRNSGQRLTTTTISSVCKKAMIKAGFNSSHLTAHSLRHTAITTALLSGMSLADVQQFARHSSINTTMIYNHAINRMNSQCENVIANAFFD